MRDRQLSAAPEPQLVCDTEDLDALMNVDALVITLPARRTGAGRVLSTSGAGDRRYRAGLPYSADRLHQLHLGVWQRQRYSEGEFPRLPQTASGQVLRSWRTGCTTCRGHRWIFCAGRAGGAFPPSGTFFAGKSAPDGQHVVNLVHCRMWWPLSNFCCRPRRAGIYNLCAPRHPARGLFIRRWPASSVCRRRCSATARTAAGKIVDGNRICNELGFEYQYPIRW